MVEGDWFSPLNTSTFKIHSKIVFVSNLSIVSKKSREQAPLIVEFDIFSIIEMLDTEMFIYFISSKYDKMF